MIFAPALSLLGFLVLVILPLVGVLGTIPMVGIVIARSCKKHPPLSRKARTWMWALAAFLAVADLWTGLLFYQFHSVARDVDEKHANRVARENFILDRDFQYGELAIPAGSQINRYDPFDNGEKDAPLGLRGLRLLDKLGRWRKQRHPDVVEIAAGEFFLGHAARWAPHGADAQAFIGVTRLAEPDDA